MANINYPKCPIVEKFFSTKTTARIRISQVFVPEHGWKDQMWAFTRSNIERLAGYGVMSVTLEKFDSERQIMRKADFSIREIMESFDSGLFKGQTKSKAPYLLVKLGTIVGYAHSTDTAVQNRARKLGASIVANPNI